MFSLLSIALLSVATTATCSFAAPTTTTTTTTTFERREPHPILSCFPAVPDAHTVAIAPTKDYNYAWFIFENEDLTIKNVSFRNAHDIYEGVKYNNNFVISQHDSANNNYRFTCGVDGKSAEQCFVRSDAFLTCAELQEGGSIGLAACKTFEDDPQTIEAGNQAWDIV
ncbi:hypothetical protein JCM3766R1_002225 [Sporobolomyces carnicolor]